MKKSGKNICKGSPLDSRFVSRYHVIDKAIQEGRLQEAASGMAQLLQGNEIPTIELRRKIYSNYLMLLHYLPDIADDELCTRQFAYQQLFSGIKQYQHVKRKPEKLRIGYISPDFNEHVDVFFFIQLLACYDRNRYEVFCYATSGKIDAVTEQLQQWTDGWRDLSEMTAARAAAQIYQDQVDILFDLSGHCDGGKGLQIAAYKPAPVQLSGIGWFDTTGLLAMDYFLGDCYCDPGGSETWFSERLLRLPGSHLCYTPSARVLAVKRTYHLHQPVVFGCFNNFAKITDEILQVWRIILQSVPGSKLVLKGSQAHSPMQRALQVRLQHAGFSPGQVEIRPASLGYLEEYLDLDIALDTYPYPGGGTTCEALYMGVPVITRYGQRHGSRFGYSILENIGMGELAAVSWEAYAERVIALAQDTELLRALHGQLRQRMQASTLMDGQGYTRAVEAKYEEIWRNWLEN